MAQKARVVISFELPGDLRSEEMEFLDQTLQLQEQTGVVSTWASPNSSELRDILHPYRQSHEIALSAPPASHFGDRSQFAAWLLQRTQLAESQRIAIRTLFADASTIREQLDLLVKHRIATLAARGSVAKQQDELSRFGVMAPPAPLHLNGDFAWWSGGPRGAVRRALHQTIQQGGLLHITANIRLAIQQERQEGVWAAIQDAGHRQRYGLVEVAAFREVAQRHRILRTGTGHSILRAA